MARRRKTEKDIRCPLEYAIDVFGGRWKSRVICLLGNCGPLRYGEIRDQMANVSDTALASALKDLAASGMVHRSQYDEIPPRVEYELTTKGASLIPVLQAACQWAGQYHRDVTSDAPGMCHACDFTADR